jgi:hypothetical protein
MSALIPKLALYEKSRPNGLMSEFEGRPDPRRTWDFGSD